MVYSEGRKELVCLDVAMQLNSSWKVCLNIRPLFVEH